MPAHSPHITAGMAMCGPLTMCAPRIVVCMAVRECVELSRRLQSMEMTGLGQCELRITRELAVLVCAMLYRLAMRPFVSSSLAWGWPCVRCPVVSMTSLGHASLASRRF